MRMGPQVQHAVSLGHALYRRDICLIRAWAFIWLDDHARERVSKRLFAVRSFCRRLYSIQVVAIP